MTVVAFIYVKTIHTLDTFAVVLLVMDGIVMVMVVVVLIVVLSLLLYYSRVMLCYMVICKAPLTGGYSEALSA